jgi:hypothetical protein
MVVGVGGRIGDDLVGRIAELFATSRTHQQARRCR